MKSLSETSLSLYNKGNSIIGDSVDEDKSEPLIYITIGNCYFNEIDVIA